MSVLVCVELPGARVLPGIVRLTCVHGCRLWHAREPRTESVCVCFVRFLRHVDTVADIIEPKTRARQLCLTGTGASGRLRTVQW